MQSPNTLIFPGFQINLTCQIFFVDIFNASPVVSVMWKRNGVGVVSNKQISVEQPSIRVGAGTYEQTLVFNSIQHEDYGNYSCDSNVSITAQDFDSQESGNPDFYAVTIQSELIHCQCDQKVNRGNASF